MRRRKNQFAFSVKEDYDLKELHGLDYTPLEYLKAIKDDLSSTEDQPTEA